MRIEGRKASALNPTNVAAEEASEREPAQPIGEGLGVFRALLITVLFYIAFGFLIWFTWYAFAHHHAQ